MRNCPDQVSTIVQCVILPFILSSSLLTGPVLFCFVNYLGKILIALYCAAAAAAATLALVLCNYESE